MNAGINVCSPDGRATLDHFEHRRRVSRLERAPGERWLFIFAPR